MSTRFLPTPSARRATACVNNAAHVRIHFYPRPPRGGRHTHVFLLPPSSIFLPTPSARRATYWPISSKTVDGISTHALREEGDGATALAAVSAVHFYPRPPRGGRPWCTTMKLSDPTYFYPRPPRGGRPSQQHFAQGRPDFYPRPPRGGRQVARQGVPPRWRFLPTPSARRATGSGG